MDEHFPYALIAHPATSEVIVMIVDEQSEAQAIAAELRRSGQRIEVKPYTSRSLQPAAD